MDKTERFIPLRFERKSEAEMLKASREFLEKITQRRTVRDFSEEEIPEEIILNCILSASKAPNGANLQPWFFVVVKNPEVKKEIRKRAEILEKEFYERKAPEEWLDKLAPLGTNSEKEFLEKAPYLIVVFERKYDVLPNGEKSKLYYVKESVGIATGILITALHFSGMATLTYTPERMTFLNEILKRPNNEKPFIVIVAGYPNANAKVPNINKKGLSEICEVI